MNINSDRIDLTVKLLDERNFGPDTLSLLREIVSQQKLADFFVKVMDFEVRKWQIPEYAVSNIMGIAEELFDFDKVVALLLMTQLYSYANKFYMRDIVDAIDIWVFKNHTSELKSQLELNPPLNMDEDMKSFYEEWINYAPKKKGSTKLT